MARCNGGQEMHLGCFPFLLEAQLGRASERLQYRRQKGWCRTSNNPAHYDAIGRLERVSPLGRLSPALNMRLFALMEERMATPIENHREVLRGIDRRGIVSRRGSPATCSRRQGSLDEAA